MSVDRIVKLRNPDLLRSLRVDADLSQYELASLAGVTRGAVAHWEAGRRDQVTRGCAVEIARALQIPPRVLFVPIGETDGPRPGISGVAARAGRKPAADLTRARAGAR